VPTICRFYGITIAMYFDDHGHPHFHARHADGEATVRIDQVAVLDSTLEVRHLRLVLAWAGTPPSGAAGELAAGASR